MNAKFSSIAVLLLCANTAHSADLFEDELRPTVTGATSWSGLYLGMSMSWTRTQDTQQNFPIPFLGASKVHFEGEDLGYGYHVGYMHQFGNFVAGVEWEHANLDIQYSGKMLSAPNLNLGDLPLYLESSDNLKARLGYAMDRVLLYGTAGMSYGKIDAGLADWVPLVGAGVDFMVSDHVLVGMEYVHNWFDEFDGEPIKGTLDNFAVRMSAKF